jgi:hypothetical protein
MIMIFIAIAILQSVAISLGVGSSTLAIVNFFVAIADGKIDPQERKLMGVVYIVLRVAMILILLCALFLALIHISVTDAPYLTPFTASLWTLVAVLYLNAVLMTKHIMPSNVGPALQASTWYTLGVIVSLIPLGLAGYSYFEFIVGYAAAIALAVAIVNGMMSYLKKRRAGSKNK